MCKLLTTWCSAILFGVASVAVAGPQEAPTPPVQSADPQTREVPPPGGNADYLEQQPDQNNSRPSKDAGDMKQQKSKVKQPGKSHQKQPEGGGVEVK